MTNELAGEIQPAADFAVTEWVPGANPAKVPDAWSALPSTLYVAAPAELTLTLPVDTKQVGFVMVAVGAAGVAGCALTTKLVAVEIQPAED